MKSGLIFDCMVPTGMIEKAIQTSDFQPVIPVSAEKCTEVEIRSILKENPRWLVIGGGTLLDKVKMANVASSELTPTRFRGLKLIDSKALRELTVMPSTLGTGTENNPKAMVSCEGRRVLVIGSCLQPSRCIYSKYMYSSLSPNQISGGFLEVFFRILSTWTMKGGSSSPALRKLAIQFRDALLTYTESSSEASILELAKISGATHHVLSGENGVRFGWPHWYMSNELANIAQTSKIDANCFLFPKLLSGLPRESEAIAKIRSFENYIEQSALGMFEKIDYAVSGSAQEKFAAVNKREMLTRCISQWGGRGGPFEGYSRRNVEGILEFAS